MKQNKQKTLGNYFIGDFFFCEFSMLSTVWISLSADHTTHQKQKNKKQKKANTKQNQKQLMY